MARRTIIDNVAVPHVFMMHFLIKNPVRYLDKQAEAAEFLKAVSIITNGPKVKPENITVGTVHCGMEVIYQIRGQERITKCHRRDYLFTDIIPSELEAEIRESYDAIVEIDDVLKKLKHKNIHMILDYFKKKFNVSEPRISKRD